MKARERGGNFWEKNLATKETMKHEGQGATESVSESNF